MTKDVPTFRPYASLQAQTAPVRGSAASRGYGRRWQKARASFLAEFPLCQCDDPDCNRPASEVHHIRAHRGDQALFWDRQNWQALTKECHSRLTAREGRRSY